MATEHRVVRVHGGRLVNEDPRVDLASQLDVASAEGFALVDTFTIDDNLYLVLRRQTGAGSGPGSGPESGSARAGPGDGT
ncbi:MAG: hypothetical protein M0Z93_03860 [Actinomycetota bacterium]|jgi:hypothetical protein|nr:hypothetical protein [Actinomycetota bacterium]